MAYLQPRKVKYRNAFRGKLGGKAQRGNRLSFGDYGLKALSSAWLTSRQLEAGRRAITNRTKRTGKVWIRVFPDKPVSDKPSEVRMGKGKGPLSHYVAPVKRGRIIFEMAGVSEKDAVEALEVAASKLPVKTKVVKREGHG